jgi:hypothetical protein
LLRLSQPFYPLQATIGHAVGLLLFGLLHELLLLLLQLKGALSRRLSLLLAFGSFVLRFLDDGPDVAERL